MCASSERRCLEGTSLSDWNRWRRLLIEMHSALERSRQVLEVVKLEFQTVDPDDEDDETVDLDDEDDETKMSYCQHLPVPTGSASEIVDAKLARTNPIRLRRTFRSLRHPQRGC